MNHGTWLNWFTTKPYHLLSWQINKNEQLLMIKCPITFSWMTLLASVLNVIHSTWCWSSDPVTPERIFVPLLNCIIFKITTNALIRRTNICWLVDLSEKMLKMIRFLNYLLSVGGGLKSVPGDGTEGIVSVLALSISNLMPLTVSQPYLQFWSPQEPPRQTLKCARHIGKWPHVVSRFHLAPFWALLTFFTVSFDALTLHCAAGSICKIQKTWLVSVGK